jgi:acetyl esterase/lipase
MLVPPQAVSKNITAISAVKNIRFFMIIYPYPVIFRSSRYSRGFQKSRTVPCYSILSDARSKSKESHGCREITDWKYMAFYGIIKPGKAEDGFTAEESSLLLLGGPSMKIERFMIDRELRAAGAIFKLLNFTFTEPGMRFMNRLMTKHRLIRIKSKTLEVTEEQIPRRDGTGMRVLIFRPLGLKDSAPGVLWLHGGGYAIGAPETAVWKADWLTAVCDCVVVAPAYRLSVQAPFPAALEDSYDALLWMKESAQRLGIRDNQLMVGGDSAGGGLTAALTLYARDRGEVAVAFQMPLYPMLDDRMETDSAQNNNAPVWNSKANRTAWKLYLGALFGTPDVPGYAAAARAADYTRLPPTATFVGSLEPFRDETIHYVDSLKRAGVPVDFALFDGCYHAFETLRPKTLVSKRAVAFLQDAFRHAAEHYFAQQPEKQGDCSHAFCLI